MVKTEMVMELYELSYSDLITLSSDKQSSFPSVDEIRRLEAVSGAVANNLGPTGPGLLTITGVPTAPSFRNALLPLARELALLPNHHRKRILKEHGLGSDVPLKNLDRTVSSFAMQFKYEHCWDFAPSSIAADNTSDGDAIHEPAEPSSSDDRMIGSSDDKFKGLGSIFKELGLCMIHLWLRLARICDRAIGGQELETSLLESHAAKGRLIHYHSPLDTQLLKEAESKNQGRLKHPSACTTYAVNTESWQQWHYDYGVFTVLTSPMFISTRYDRGEDGIIRDLKSCECPSPSGHSYLQIFDPNMNKVCTIKAPPDSFIVQVGESADILSKGKLRSTLHSVCRAGELEDLTRETFVVFLQPAWTKVFDLTDYPVERRQPTIENGKNCSSTDKRFEDEQHKKQNEEIRNIVPQLWSRVKNGMTFAESSQETTKQYYGGGGLQAPTKQLNIWMANSLQQ